MTVNEQKKRKRAGTVAKEAPPTVNSDEEGYEDDEQDEELIDVDFDFYNPKDIDYHGLKSLLGQTFANDSHLVNVGDMAELIISQPNVGTTVKAKDNLDPYAIITVLNLTLHQDKECIKSLREYILEKAQDTPASTKFTSVLNDTKHHVGLIINERLINMPPQVALPAFKMLMEEVQWAVEDDQPFDFEYFITISKTYREVESELDGPAEGASQKQPIDVKGKKRKVSSTKSAAATPSAKKDEIFYFHTEDEIFEKKCEAYFDYTFEKEAQVSDSRRVFLEMGIDPARRVFLFHRNVLPEVMADLELVLAAE
ncbi:hypothetical protein SmJEL517_g04069 [Synchytrium microbalum]|uniref:Protein BCP1 n=1 Tax=Synchytrium microbalum TaxID=1806994 RepID=A0A507C0G6_9FUNG|nr:uncharacterized protein SmJEL517_g04069 [Synchytrium microbalum]TPX32901.1 hypothetical protein SmJEL517_g04069 [Synchytrium microbalum]